MPLNPHTSQLGQDAGGGAIAQPEKLRVGVRQLPAPDIMLVRAFVQMSATFTANFPWIFVEEPPFDLVLVDANSRQHLQASAADSAVEVLLITDDGAQGPGTMQRPLRYRVLEEWLKQRAGEIRTARLERPRRPDPPAAPELPDGSDLYIQKLERWPPSAFLQHDRLRLRVATMLAANGMNLSDLARLCREPEERARHCVKAFLDAGLVQIETTPRRGGAPRLAADGRQDGTEPARKPRPGLGFIASIRRRLGL